MFDFHSFMLYNIFFYASQIRLFQKTLLLQKVVSKITYLLLTNYQAKSE